MLLELLLYVYCRICWLVCKVVSPTGIMGYFRWDFGKSLKHEVVGRQHAVLGGWQ